MRVCIFVANNCTTDSRVLRQAETFALAGHETVVVAVHRGDVPEVEDRDGFQIRRVPSRYTWREAFPRLIGIPARLFLGRGPMDIGSTAREGAAPTAAATPAPGAAGPGATAATPPRGRPRRGAMKILRLFDADVQRAMGRRVRSLRRALNKRFVYPRRYRILDRRLIREGLRLRADLYWGNDMATIRAAHACARATGARSVYDAHEVIWDAPTISPSDRQMWGRVEEKHIRTFTRLYTVCDPIARVMAERYQIAPPTVVLNCPRLDATSAAPPPEASPLNAYREPGEHLILFHGSLSIERGLEQLVEAVAQLGAGYRLVILGHGPFRATLEGHAARVNATDRVTFLQSVPPSVLPGWIAGADIGMIPYQRTGLNHEYSTPNKLFEYMHLGIPVIANDLPEIRRILEDAGSFGMIVDCSDVGAIAGAIKELCADPGRRARMRAAALAAAPRYSWEAQEPSILAALG